MLRVSADMTWSNAATVIVTLVVTLLVLNLSLGNKQVDARLSHTFAVADPQFLRAMSGMLSPPLVQGNRVEELLNGDQIFPAMLSAIRGAQRTITFET